jgi:tRNA threonylcarbamoyladenosine biosynthesis protein TsaE
MTRESRSSAETEQLGAELANTLRPGDVVLIEGELGTGKTTFVRGAARALGVTAVVTSPTFTIGQRYPGPVPVAHVDLYRVADLGREDPDLLAGYLGPDLVTFIEWPQVARLDATAAYHVKLAHAGGDTRRVEIRAGEIEPTPRQR